MVLFNSTTLAKLGIVLYQQIFNLNRSDYYLTRFINDHKDGGQMLYSITINEKSSLEFFETFNGDGGNIHETKKCCYLKFILKTKLARLVALKKFKKYVEKCF